MQRSAATCDRLSPNLRSFIDLGRSDMRNVLVTLVAASALVLGPAVGPASAQNARALLQADDNAVGASKVNSIQYTGTGRISYLGQNFTTVDDWNRGDLKRGSQTSDYGSKSAKEEMMRVQGNNPPRGGGAGFPITGEQRSTTLVSGNYAWNLNAQGQPQAQNDQAEVRQFMIWVTPHGFIKAALADPNATVTDREFVWAGRR